jgi:hypothetical protein
MNMKGKSCAGIGLSCLLLLLVCGSGTGVVLGETIQLSGPEDASDGVFFRDKFACARWVEKKSPDSKCLECHASIMKEEEIKVDERQGSSSGVMMIHAQHMRSGKVNFTCLTCHKAVDPYQTSATGLRTQVSANMCFKCHFPHGQE